MAASASALPARFNVKASALVPRTRANALLADFGGPVPLPSTIARGFIFTRSFVQDRSKYFPRTAYAWFGRGGRKLRWTVAPSGYGPDTTCTRSGPRYPVGEFIDGRSVYLADGVQGQAAWICVTEPKRITIELWSDHSVSRKALVRMVASAHE
ncbi:hypothetical protein BH18ACT13_BH18ACT13_16350 [soil metagenome]